MRADILSAPAVRRPLPHLTQPDLRDTLQQSLAGTYTLDRELGGGGMSRVFVASDTRLGRRVVVKVLSPELAAGISAERFEREIRLAASLQQANIVPVLSAGDTGGLPFYTMPFIEGESLRAHLAAHAPLPIADVVSILRDVARALAYAHDRGIVHRDIKPDNVLLSGGAAVVTDFGIAKALSAARTRGDGATLTQLGTAIGTPAYIAPEQAAGDPDVDHRADIYAFGCMAYEMLAGRPPFIDRSPHRLMAAHMTEQPQPVNELRPDTPAALTRMVMRCLAKDPPARPNAAAELIAALDASSSSAPGRAAMPRVLLGGPGTLRKALLVYAAAFVSVGVVAKAAILTLGLPEWVFPGALVVMGLGLPVILFTAYSQSVARRAFTATPTYTPGGTPSIGAQGTMATLAIKASPHLSWRRTMFGGAYALIGFGLLVGVLMLLRALGIGPAGSLLAAGRFNAATPVLIADFTTTNTDSALGSVVSDAVRAGLSQSSVIKLLRPSEVASTLRLMQQPANVRLDLPLARDVAQREGVQAIVDGSVTGVAGGYILTLRLVTADSGVELASFRESGDGPRGLIDAADKVARELRGKIGESLRDVQATPPLSRVTTSSLQALRLYSAGSRANNVESNPAKALALWRSAAQVDTTFASAWMGISTAMSNLGMSQAGIDSVLNRVYGERDHLTDADRSKFMTVYLMRGPHRDRQKAAAALLDLARNASGSVGSHLINAGEMFRSQRAFALADSLNRVGIALDTSNGIGYYNHVELELDQGHTDSARRVLATATRRLPAGFGPTRLELGTYIAYADGDLKLAQQTADSERISADPGFNQFGAALTGNIAVVRGQIARGESLLIGSNGGQPEISPTTRLLDSLGAAAMDSWFRGENVGAVKRIDSALALYPLRSIPLEDRPYFTIATDYARAGRVDRARATMAAYRAAVTDTAMLRIEDADMHNALGEIALASNDARTAVAEFRLGDIGYDGKPARECGPCVHFNLARAFDAGNMPDSALAEYEVFVNTPYYNRSQEVDPFGLAGSEKRLGELYEAKGDRARALAHYGRFVAIWKDADPELQPRVAEVRRRMARLTAAEPR